MANTYTLIASNTLSSAAASVTFSAIPNTYTDLVVKVSCRDDIAGTAEIFKLQINGNTTSTNYSQTELRGTGAAASSARTATTTGVSSFRGYNPGTTATADTFNNYELYIPNYTSSSKKVISAISASESNTATITYVNYLIAGSYHDTTAISSLLFTPNGANFVSGSSFFLYGIKNS